MRENNYNTDRPLLRIATAGSVDDGKSTLIGRLFYDCDNIADDQLENLKKISQKLGRAGIDLSFFTDGLESEREQGITIDVAYRYFNTTKRRIIIADVPGHEQYTRNMVTGAASSDAVLILVDASQGMTEQSRRHLFISTLLDVQHIAVIVNKMDSVKYSQKIFEDIKKDFIDYASKLRIADLDFIPTSALKGDMVVNRGAHMSWYGGDTLLHYLENIPVYSKRDIIDLRFPVQGVYRDKRGNRFYSGKIEGGILKTGEEVVVLPSNKISKIESLFVGEKSLEYAFDPQSVAVRLSDDIDVGRGDMIVRKSNLPEISQDIEAMLCWLGSEPAKEGTRFILKHTTNTTKALINSIHYKLDVNTTHRSSEKNLNTHDIGKVSMRLLKPIMFDTYQKNKNTGSFILIDDLTKNTVAAGIILGKASTETQEENIVHAKKGFVLWLTGLSGSGKSSIADALSKKLDSIGVQTERLDGDILRQSLCKDLGYSKEDRDTNIERASILARYLSKHGIGVIASFISPYQKQRELARVGVDNFIEIYVNAPLEVCQARDTKGLYRKAIDKQINNFTGMGDPYEAPENPDIELKTDKYSIDECVDKIISYLREKNFI